MFDKLERDEIPKDKNAQQMVNVDSQHLLIELPMGEGCERHLGHETDWVAPVLRSSRLSEEERQIHK